MNIPVEIPVEHQNDDQPNNQNDQDTAYEYLLIPVQRIQKSLIRVYVTRYVSIGSIYLDNT